MIHPSGLPVLGLALSIGVSATTAPAAGDTATSRMIDAWVVPPVVASDTRLPTLPGHVVRWRADGAALRGDGLVNDRATPVTMRLTGIVALPGGGTAAKTFTVTVLGADGQRLVGYVRTPTGAPDANQPMVARSLHLALGAGTAPAKPLNDDYGVVFARGEYRAVDQVSLRGLADPSLFYFADGGIGVIATRVTMAGAPDASQSSSALVFRSDPKSPADFVELGPIDLRTTGGVVSPHAVWDSAARRYLVGWTDRAGQARWTTVEDLARTERVATPFFPEHGGRALRVASAGNVGEAQSGRIATIAPGVPPPPGAPSATALPVTAAMAAALTGRFGRIANVRADVAPLTIAAGDVSRVERARVRLTYSDGSTATRAVDWNAADLRRLATAGPGTYGVRGTVRQTAYPTIFAFNRADPTIYRYDHAGRTRYLFIATDDTGNGNVESPHLPIRVADSIAALADTNGGRAREVDLLNRRTRRDRTVEGRVIAGCYWAPEIHEIGGRLTILFAPCFNPEDNQSNERGSWSTVRSHVMQLRDGGDPGNPADWSRPAAVLKADGSPLGRADFPGNISLDMSYFEVGGRAYYTWSQRYIPEGQPLGDPLTWIAKVDPARPTRLTSAPRPIIAPDLSVEENLAEGAFAQIRDGRVNLIYSSSSVSPTYVVNGVWARIGDDLTDIDSWHKWGSPLQKSVAMPAGVTDYLRYEQGPGHGAFTTDDDGNPLYVYHSWGNGVGGDGRDTRVRRVHWAADGRPVLDMTPAEEVSPANRAVTMAVTVRR